jgi:hypothetical protein
MTTYIVWADVNHRRAPTIEAKDFIGKFEYFPAFNIRELGYTVIVIIVTTSDGELE